MHRKFRAVHSEKAAKTTLGRALAHCEQGRYTVGLEQPLWLEGRGDRSVAIQVRSNYCLKRAFA
jgi:hypothetical protein